MATGSAIFRIADALSSPGDFRAADRDRIHSPRAVASRGNKVCDRLCPGRKAVARMDQPVVSDF